MSLKKIRGAYRTLKSEIKAELSKGGPKDPSEYYEVEPRHHICSPCRRLLQGGQGISFAPYRSYLRDKFNLSQNDQAVDIVPHHENFRAFVSSANGGCHVCAIFLLQLNPWEQGKMMFFDFPGFGSVHFCEKDKKGLLEIHLLYFEPPEVRESRRFTGIKLQLRPTQEELCAVDTAVEQPQSLLKLNVIPGWVSNCTTNHRRCTSALPSSGAGPSRLIYVGKKPDFSDVRLYKNFSNKPYITLSHCWGPQGVPLQLLTNNLTDFQHHIPWARLPKTFQEAIEVVREIGQPLGVSHLWIDALCILQDSKTDQEAVISRIGEIYSQSVCNFAVCLGRDSSCGLGLRAQQSHSYGCVVETRFANHSCNRAKIENYEIYDSLVTTCTLGTRGWVLQELILAPRVVYFTSQGLIWECTEALCHQAAAWDNRSPATGALKSLQDPTKVSPELLNSADRYEDLFYRFWQDQVFEYTTRKLTFSRDRLHAISAIARATQDLLGSGEEYMLGLWRKHLHLQLLWVVLKNKEDFESLGIPEPGRPSWSWIGAPGSSIANMHMARSVQEGYQPLAELTPHVSYPDGAGPLGRFGEPAAAPELAVRGQLVLAVASVERSRRVGIHLVDAKGALKQLMLGNYRSLFRLDFHRADAPLEDHGGGKEDRKFREFSRFVRAREGIDLLPGEDDGSGGDEEAAEYQWVHCLFIARLTNSTVNGLAGLVLKKLDVAPGTYRRVGTFIVERPENKGLLEEIKTKYPLEVDDYQEKFDDGTYKITIL